MLKQEYVSKIRNDKQLRTKIMLVANISHPTLYRMLRLNSINLTTADILRVVSEHFHVSKDELLEPSKKIEI
jgi:chromosomal replication initiation ATPase DnaA